MVPSLAPAPPGHSRLLEPGAYNVVGAEEEGLPPGILGNMQTSWCHVTWRHPHPTPSSPHPRPDIWALLRQTGPAQAVTPPRSPSPKVLSLLDFDARLPQTAPQRATTFSLLSFPSADPLARKAHGGAGTQASVLVPSGAGSAPTPSLFPYRGQALENTSGPPSLGRTQRYPGFDPQPHTMGPV